MISRNLEVELIKLKLQYNLTHIKILLTEDRNGTFLNIIKYCKDIFDRYEFVCYINLTKQNDAISYEDEHNKMLWNNLLGSDDYIHNIVQVFRKNPHIGILYPPISLYGKCLDEIGKGWADWYDLSEKLVRKLRLNCKMSENIPPMSIEDSFWCRAKTLAKIFTFPLDLMSSASLENVLNRIACFIIQDAGYCCGTVRDVDYAGACINSYEASNELFFRNFRKNNAVLNLKSSIGFSGEESLLSFSRKVNKLYVYGAGKYGKKIFDFLLAQGIRISGFIISDGQLKNQGLKGTEIFYLKELNLDTEADGIVISLGSASKWEIFHQLEEKGYKYLFVY